MSVERNFLDLKYTQRKHLKTLNDPHTGKLGISRSPLIFPCWCVRECVCTCHAYAEVNWKNCDLICYSHRGNLSRETYTVLNVYVHLGRPISVSNSAYEIARMQNGKKRNVNFPMSRLLNICIWRVLVCVYVRRSLPNGFIYCSLNGIFHHDENSLLFIHFIQTENIFVCVWVENRLKYLKQRVCLFQFFAIKKKRKERRRKAVFENTTSFPKSFCCILFVCVCASEIKFFAWLISIY